MTTSWAISGVDLHLEIAGPRRRAGLEDALRDAVRTGRLAAGTPLPSSRALARDLGLARNTVAQAYGQLVAEGWLVARQGSGTRVADRAAAVRAATFAPAATARAAPLRYDLSPGAPDVSAFPRTAWLAAARRALNAAPDAALRYGDPRGRPELREALAAYLARARGVSVTPGRLVICSGFTQGLSLLCEALRARGARTIAFEGYGLADYRAIAAARGLEADTLDVDAHGAVVDRLSGQDAAVLTPAHQFPLGAALAPERRARAVEWATAGGALLIEDDYDGEFRYDRQPLGAVQGLAPDHVVYAGTASKTLAPALRLGWLALPAELVEEVVAAKTLADRQTGTLEQLTLAELIASGAYDRQVRRARLAYRRRRDRLVAALARAAPHVRVTGIAAGLNALAELPGDHDEDDVVGGAASRGLELAGLRLYTAPGHERGPALVVGYSTPPEHAFTAALARLAATLAEGR